jgi:hypothetical protein
MAARIGKHAVLAGKMRRRFAAGMFRPKVYAQRNDLAVAEAEPPTGPVCPAGQKSVNSPVMRSKNCREAPAMDGGSFFVYSFIFYKYHSVSFS